MKLIFLTLLGLFVSLTSIQAQWVQIGEDIDGKEAYDYSGISLSLSDDGSIVGIGAFVNDGNGTDAGAWKDI